MIKWRKFNLEDSPLYDRIVRMESEYDRRKRLLTVCKRCLYAGVTGTNNTVVSCDYLLITGHIRPCSPVDCVKAGVFVPADGQRRKYRLSISKGGLTCETNG